MSMRSAYSMGRCFRVGENSEKEEVMQTIGNICAITACVCAVLIIINYFKAYFLTQGFHAGYRRALLDMVKGDNGNGK